MQSQGVVLNAITYNAMIGICDKGQQQQALELCGATRRQGVVPNAITYSV